MDQIISVDRNYISLMLAMLRSAHVEARRLGPFSNGWQWLLSDDCRLICEAMGWNYSIIPRRLAQLEAERFYPKPAPVVFLEVFLGGMSHG